MKSIRFFGVLVIAALWLGSASAQTPTISSIVVNGCTYTVGISTTPCKMAPVMTLVVNGANFGSVGGIVNTCDCNQITVQSGNWTTTANQR
jgi:hypothetical protein